MYDNAKTAEQERQKGIDPHPKILCNFRSPPFYTSTHGYRFDMKLYPYGCPPATGESTSLVINIPPSEFNPIRPVLYDPAKVCMCFPFLIPHNKLFKASPNSFSKIRF